MFALLAITESDTFVDVGSGVNNVVAQVALESRVNMCIGIEMRKGVQEFGQKLLSSRVSSYPALSKVKFMQRKMEDVADQELSSATIIYSFNNLFEVGSLLHLEVRLCELASLRMLALTRPPCPRHRPRCRREFCLLWNQVETVDCEVTYASSVVVMYVSINNAFIYNQ